jgi:hypothetical protein
MNTSEIRKIENSNGYWEKHFSLNNWWLVKPYFVLGKYWGDDKSGTHCYGWVNEIMFGKDKGKFEAGIPELYDDETGSDARSLGIFDSLEKAMEEVFITNNPDYSCIHV